LTFAIGSVGTYAFEFMIFCVGNTVGTMGISFNVNYSAAFSSLSQCYISSASLPNNAALVQSAVTTSMGSIATVSSVLSTPTAILIKGTLAATATGTLGFSWAQANSVSNSLSVINGSYLTIFAI